LALITPFTVVAMPVSAAADSVVAAGPGTNYAVDDPFTTARLHWWRSNRFGMFIHFGAYSYWGGEYQRPDGTVCQDAEWIVNRCKIPWPEYEAAARRFNLDYTERTGEAYLKLLWANPYRKQRIIPTSQLYRS